MDEPVASRPAANAANVATAANAANVATAANAANVATAANAANVATAANARQAVTTVDGARTVTAADAANSATAADAANSATAADGTGEATTVVMRVPTPPELLAVRTRSASVALLAILAVFYTLYLTQSLLEPVVLAIVLNLLLTPAMRFLNNRLHLPRALAALALILLLFSVVGGIGFAVSLPASGWIAKAPQAYQVLQQKFAPMSSVMGRVRDGLKSVEHLLAQSDEADGEAKKAEPAQQQQQQQPSVGGAAMGVGSAILSGTTSFLGGLFTLLLLLFFLLSAGDSLLRRLVEVLPTFADKRRAVAMASEIETNIAAYLATISMMNLLVGVANGVSIWLLGLPDPLLFGTLAFLLNYIPIIGPLCGVVIFFFVGLFTAPSVWIAAAAAAIYLGIHILEGETVTPMLLAKRFTLNPVLVIVSLLFWHWLWGITGAFLSVPLLAVFKIVCDHVDALAPLGHMLGAEGSERKRPAG